MGWRRLAMTLIAVNAINICRLVADTQLRLPKYR